MTREGLDSLGEAIEAEQQDGRYAEQAQQAERMANGVMCYECGEFVAIPRGRPTMCRTCGDGSGPVTRHPSEDPIGPEPGHEFVENAWHVSGRYYANEADAAFWRSLYAAQHRKTLAQIAQHEQARAAEVQAATDHAA